MARITGRKIDIVVGRRIRAARLGRDCTVETLAVELGVEPAEVERIEQGEARAGAELIYRMCLFLGFMPPVLFSEPRLVADEAADSEPLLPEPVEDPVLKGKG